MRMHLRLSFCPTFTATSRAIRATSSRATLKVTSRVTVATASWVIASVCVEGKFGDSQQPRDGT